MKAMKWIALGLLTIGASLSVVGLVIRMRDRDEMREKLIQYLPGATGK